MFGKNIIFVHIYIYSLKLFYGDILKFMKKLYFFSLKIFLHLSVKKNY